MALREQDRKNDKGDRLRTVIIGAGAVGLGLGSCLHAAGQAVSFVVRDTATAHSLEQHGIERTGLFGDVRVAPGEVQVLRSIEALSRHEADCVLVCTKTTATPTLAEELGAVWSTLPGMPALVVCQNGWGNAEIFAERIAVERIFNAMIITGFRRLAPHSVEVTVHANPIRVGSLFGADLAPVRPLCSAIDRGGIPCEPSEDIGRDLWAKVLYNCLLNPLGALVGVPYGELGERASTRCIMEKVAREVFAVLEAGGQRTHWPDPESYLRTFYDELLPPTAEHESSMLQDLRAGRATEVDALSGAVAALGQERGIDTPVNLALCHLVHVAELRGGGSLSLDGLTA